MKLATTMLLLIATVMCTGRANGDSAKSKSTSTSPKTQAATETINALSKIVSFQEAELVRLKLVAKQGGVAPKKVSEAEQQVADARIKLAEARQDVDELVKLNEASVQLHENQVARLQRLEKQGAVAKAELKRAQLALLVANTKLAEARAARVQAAEKPAAGKRDAKLQKLLQERRDVLFKQFEFVKEAIRVKESSHQDLIRAATNLLEAELELATTAQARVKLLQGHVETLMKAEQNTSAMYKAGVTSISVVLELQAERLKAQIRLHREISGEN